MGLHYIKTIKKQTSFSVWFSSCNFRAPLKISVTELTCSSSTWSSSLVQLVNLPFWRENVSSFFFFCTKTCHQLNMTHFKWLCWCLRTFNLNHQSRRQWRFLFHWWGKHCTSHNHPRLTKYSSDCCRWTPSAVDARREALWNTKRRLPDVLLKPVEEAPCWLLSLELQLTFSLHQRSWRRLLGNKTSAPLCCLLALQLRSSKRLALGCYSLLFLGKKATSRSCLSWRRSDMNGDAGS